MSVAYFLRVFPACTASMTQTEKNAFGAILNFSYESQTRVSLGNAGGIQLLGDILTNMKQKVG